PAQRHDLGPELVGEAPRILGHGPHVEPGSLRREHRPHAVPQRVLIVREREIHPYGLARSLRGAKGAQVSTSWPLARLLHSLALAPHRFPLGRKLLWTECRVPLGPHPPPPRRPSLPRLVVAPRVPGTGPAPRPAHRRGRHPGPCRQRGPDRRAPRAAAAPTTRCAARSPSRSS